MKIVRQAVNAQSTSRKGQRSQTTPAVTNSNYSLAQIASNLASLNGSTGLIRDGEGGMKYKTVRYCTKYIRFPIYQQCPNSSSK